MNATAWALKMATTITAIGAALIALVGIVIATRGSTRGHQADWTPDKTPALWTSARKTAGQAPDEWKQPTGAQDAYSKGDRVTFQGAVWESVIDANVWSPTGYPAGWKAV